MKKNVGWILSGLCMLLLSSAARADAPEAYGYARGFPFIGANITINRSGSSAEGIAWTEETVWRPDGGYDVIGDHYGDEAFDSDVYRPDIAGTYWVQLRVVDNDIDFTDYWYSFNIWDPHSFN